MGNLESVSTGQLWTEIASCAPRQAVEALEAQTEEESSRQMQAAKQRARREKQERLESALKEYAKLEAAKSRVKRVSTTDPDARVMKQAEGGSAPSYCLGAQLR